MSIINGLRKLKSWEWILIFILLAILFLFRFKYEYSKTSRGMILIRTNRITGTAKVYLWSESQGKYFLIKDDDY